MTPIETVYNGRDNTIDLLLKADGVAQDLSTVTRMVVAEQDDAFSVDSATSPDAFDWATGTTGVVVFAFGGEGITAGYHQCRLIVYDPTNANGVVWGSIKLTVID